jgi:hypothetical protein
MMNYQMGIQTKETLPRKGYIEAIGAYVGTIALSLLILLWVMRLWRADLAIPFFYHVGGDVFFHSMLTKGLLDNGWYLHNNFIGMPTGLGLHDFPQTHNLDFLLMKFIALFTSNFSITLNIYFLIAFPLTAVASLYTFRYFNLSYSTSIIGSILFAFLPYHFFRGQAHVFLASYYLIPLIVLVVLLVCLHKHIFYSKTGDWRSIWTCIGRKSIISIVFCVSIASVDVYYVFFATFFLFVAGAFAYFHKREPWNLLTPAIFIIIIFLVFVINILPTIIYAYEHGKNMDVGKRPPEDAEIYGMKIVQLLLPISGHRISSLAKLKEAYNRRSAGLVNENDTVSLGAIGGFGFLMLIGWLVCRRPEFRNGELCSSLAVLNISAVLLATVGGFGSLFAFLISPQIRAYNRMSVYIAFFSLFAVALLGENLMRRWAKSKSSRCLFSGSSGLILLIGILDQTSPHFVPPYEHIKAEYNSDADFVGRIEALVPENTMIFQLPYMPFPEHPPVHRMQDSDLFRGYLHSRTLRWSYGAMKGREGDAWQREVVRKPINELVETLAFIGFSGIYLDRYGYADHGEALETKLSAYLDVLPIVSANQRLVFFNLAKFTRKLREKHTTEEWQLKRDAAALIPPSRQ